MSTIKAMMVGNTLICYIKGKMYQKVIDSDEEKVAIYEKALNIDEANSDEVEQLINVFEREKSNEEIQEEVQLEKEKKKVEASESLLGWMESIKVEGDEHFEVKGIKLFMKGINITVPEFLALEFCARRDNEEDLTSLMNFWKLCALNKDPRCREDLYKFLMNHDMVVTPSGMFVAYRNVAIKSQAPAETKQKELNDFIAEQYIKTKKQKKSPKNFDILKRKEGVSLGEEPFLRKSTGFFSKLTKNSDYELVGSLEKLYQGLSNIAEKTTTVYTDNHTKRMEIVIGTPVNIPREQCDANPDRTCSKGLHLGSPSFVTRGSFGNEGLICLCNPMNVVAVPYAGGEKLRCCEYLPIGVAQYDEKGRIIPLDTATFEYDYSDHNQKEITKMLNNSRFESLIEHEIVPKELSQASLKFIHQGLEKSLNEMTKVVSSRAEKAM